MNIEKGREMFVINKKISRTFYKNLSAFHNNLSGIQKAESSGSTL